MVKFREGVIKTKEDFMKFYMHDFFEAKKYGDEKGFDVIFGLEIRFPESTNEYLVYGISEEDAYNAYDYIFGNYEEFYKAVWSKPIATLRKTKFFGYWIISHMLMSKERRQKINFFEGE